MKKIVSLLSLVLLTTSAWAANPYTSIQKPQGVLEDGGITSLSQANALENDEAFTFNGNAVVTVFKNGYLFLRDESGYGQIQGVVASEFENGQVLAPGWGANKTGNNGWVWFTDATGLSASGETNAELGAAQVLTGAVDESMVNAYVVIENVTFGFFPPRSFPLPDGTSIGKTEVLWGISASAGGNFNVYGIICKVDGALKLNPVQYEKYVEPVPTIIRGDVNDNGDVTIADVTALIDYLLSGNASGINLDNANCNLDGDVTIADVTALIDYLLSGNWSN